MTPQQRDEYRALRATIRERGTTRIVLFVVGLALWGALTIATAALAALPIATLLPLLVLAAAFEAVFALHVGVERIGRYLQVFYETDSEGGRWEHAAMAFGRPRRGTGTDPLFAVYFCAAAALNFVPVMLAEPVQIELVVVGAIHLLVIARVLFARHAAAGQRAADLQRYQELKSRP